MRHLHVLPTPAVPPRRFNVVAFLRDLFPQPTGGARCAWCGGIMPPEAACGRCGWQGGC